MGNAVFPALPGLKWGTKKTPVWSTNIQKSANGRELRAAYYSYPQWRFSLSFEVLRTKAAINELERLAGFFNARRGSFESFLYEDPTDNTVTDQLVGNTVTGVTRYQLVRSFGGFVEPVLAVKDRPAVKVGGRPLIYGRFGAEHAAGGRAADHMVGRVLFPRALYGRYGGFREHHRAFVGGQEN